MWLTSGFNAKCMFRHHGCEVDVMFVWLLGYNACTLSISTRLRETKTYQDHQGGKQNKVFSKNNLPSNGLWDWSPGEFGTAK
jgi:hypothetical protein